MQCFAGINRACYRVFAQVKIRGVFLVASQISRRTVHGKDTQVAGFRKIDTGSAAQPVLLPWGAVCPCFEIVYCLHNNQRASNAMTGHATGHIYVRIYFAGSADRVVHAIDG